MAKHGISKEVIDLEVEKSRLNREKSMLVMNKSLILYFVFMFVAVLGFINGYIQKPLLNVLVIMGLCVLIIGTVPYVKTMHSEEKRLNELIQRMTR
jgi:small-conductance mechanosensitive channel